MNPEFVASFIFANSDLRHICDNMNSQLGHDLLILVNDRVISPFREDFIFTKLRICEVSRKLNPHENFRIYSTISDTVTYIMDLADEILTLKEMLLHLIFMN